MQTAAGPAPLLLLLLAPLLAGCGSPDAAPPDVAPPAETPAVTPAPAPPAPVVVAVPFSWSGRTKEGAWVCTEQSGLGQCPAGQQVAPDGQHIGTVAYAGGFVAVDLAMSWQADPTQTGLVLAVYGNGTGQGALGVAQGDSPLTLRIEGSGLGLPPDDRLVLMVWPEGKTPTSPSLFVDVTQQAFSVEGTMWQAASA